MGGSMKLSEHINLYHGGNVTKFAASIGESRQVVANWLAVGHVIDGEGVYKVIRTLPQTEIDHVKRVRGI
jgi:hypothetical protein